MLGFYHQRTIYTAKGVYSLGTQHFLCHDLCLYGNIVFLHPLQINFFRPESKLHAIGKHITYNIHLGGADKLGSIDAGRVLIQLAWIGLLDNVPILHQYNIVRH